MTKQQQQQRDNICKLIVKIAGRTSTEALIAFVADNFGMLPACREIPDLLATPDSTESEWLRKQCCKSRISTQLLQSESERILSIFQPGLTHDDQYGLLGLTPEATISEVKSAFRKLSFRYHPDSATTQGPDDSEKFIAICRAYKKILRTDIDELQISSPDNFESTPWRHDYKPHQPPKQKRKTIFLIAAISIALLFISLSATRSYRKKAMLKSLGHTQKVAVAKKPSRPETTMLAKASETTKPPAKPVVLKAIPKTPKSAPSPVVKKQIPRKSITTTSIALKHKKTTRPKKAIRPQARPIVTKTSVPKKTSKATPLPSSPEPPKVAKKQTPATPSAPNKPQPSIPIPKSLRAAPPDKATPLVALPPLQNRIDAFLASYTNAYELLNFDTFTTFFTADAIENGTPFKEKFSQYRGLFGRLKEISYKLTPRSWRSYNDLIYLTCRFHVHFLYANGDEINLHGPTNFHLLEDQNNHFKVKDLTYSFD